jgi:hypothetical protein
MIICACHVRRKIDLGQGEPDGDRHDRHKIIEWGITMSSIELIYLCIVTGGAVAFALSLAYQSWKHPRE